MCNGQFESQDLENYVSPTSEDNSGDTGTKCSSDLGANNGGNTCGIYKCSTHGPVDPQPNWGAGGFSLDKP